MYLLPSTERPEKLDVSIVIPYTEEQIKNLLSKKKDKTSVEDIIASVISDGDFKGEKDQLLVVHTHGRIKPKHLVLLGIGKQEELTLEVVRKGCALAVQKAKAMKWERFAIITHFEKIKEQEALHAVAEGLLLGNYKFSKYKTEDKTKAVREVIILVKKIDYVKDILAETQIICEATNFVRDMQNENAYVMTTLMIEKIARDVAKEHKLKITVLDEKQLKKIGMNLLLAVGKGSRTPPRLIILEYKGAGTEEATAIIGKGITFDSGGLNLKPTTKIETMRSDMSGAAVVLGTLQAAAQLKLRKNLIGVIPTAENIIGSGAYKPGDVYMSYAGKSVEIGNTDAEGRLILADALAYTEKNLKPARIIDFATLTGAILITFGEYVAGIMGTDKETAKKMYDAGLKTYERVWELPLYEEYMEEVKSDIADLNNIGTGYPNASSISAAAFLSKFVQKTPWMHIDIAGTAWYSKSRYYMPKGGTGYGVRLMIEYLKNS
ncbi:MAG: leucyl aminopeptidase [Nanoarchaeota archaeon]